MDTIKKRLALTLFTSLFFNPSAWSQENIYPVIDNIRQCSMNYMFNHHVPEGEPLVVRGNEMEGCGLAASSQGGYILFYQKVKNNGQILTNSTDIYHGFILTSWHQAADKLTDLAHYSEKSNGLFAGYLDHNYNYISYTPQTKLVEGKNESTMLKQVTPVNFVRPYTQQPTNQLMFEFYLDPATKNP